MEATQTKNTKTQGKKGKTPQEAIQAAVEAPVLQEQAQTPEVTLEQTKRAGRPIRTKEQETEFLNSRIKALKEKRRRLVEEKLVELDSEITKVENRLLKLEKGPSETDELKKAMVKAIRAGDLAEVQRLAQQLMLVTAQEAQEGT